MGSPCPQQTLALAARKQNHSRSHYPRALVDATVRTVPPGKREVVPTYLATAGARRRRRPLVLRWLQPAFAALPVGEARVVADHSGRARLGGRSRTSQRTHRQGAHVRRIAPGDRPLRTAMQHPRLKPWAVLCLGTHWAPLCRRTGWQRWTVHRAKAGGGLSAVLSCTRRFLKGKPFRGRGLGLLPANHSAYCGRTNAPAGCACAPPAPGLRSTLPGLLLVPSCARCCLLPRTQAGASILLEKIPSRLGAPPLSGPGLSYDPNASASAREAHVGKPGLVLRASLCEAQQLEGPRRRASSC